MTDFEKFLGARARETFIGRAAECERLNRLVGRALTSIPVAAAITGPRGVGKSELLRQWLARLGERGAQVLPIYCDLKSLARPSTGPQAPPEHEIWTRLLRAVACQAIASERGLKLCEPPLLGATPAELARLCHESGLGPWAGVIENGVAQGGAERGLECWRGIVATRCASGSWAPVIAIDATGDPGPAGRVARDAVRALVGGECPIVFEADIEQVRTWPEAAQIETIELEGLTLDESQSLIEALAKGAGETAPPELCHPVLARLGGRPGLLASWRRAFAALPESMNGWRRAWEAYVEVIERSPAAAGWREALERAVPLEFRPAFVSVLAALGSSGAEAVARPWAVCEMIGRLGLEPAVVEPILRRLGSEAMLRPSGEGYEAPGLPAMVDWLALRAGGAAGGETPRTARTEFLRSLLSRYPAPSTAATPWTAPAAILLACSLQTLPEALFQFEQYFEALGHFSAARRKIDVLLANRKLRMPDVIGVIDAREAASDRRWAGTMAERVPLCYAYAYREGIYRPSHEEIWIVGDARGHATLTSLEARSFLQRADELQGRLGPGRYTRWLLTSDSVSPEALEVIAAARIYCSANEQIEVILEGGAEPGARDESPSRSAMPESAASRAPVIAIEDAGEPRAEVGSSRLSLRAESENEIVAAATAERIALRSGFTPEEAGQVKIAVLEGCLNALEHSSNPEKEISISFYERPGELEIAIDNEGEQFDPREVPEPDPREKLKAENKRGWGIKLMREFMDEVIYETKTHGTRLRLIKLHKGERPAGGRAAHATPGRP